MSEHLKRLKRWKVNTKKDTEQLQLKRFGLASIILSEVQQENWKKTSIYLKNIFKTKGLIAEIIVKIFGKDELWVMFEYTDLKNVNKLADEQFFNYSALLGKFEFDEKRVVQISRKKEQTEYLFIERQPIELEQIKEVIKDVGGKYFLIGELKHPKGYSHAILFTLKKNKIFDVDMAVSLAVKKLEARKYECILGARHEWFKPKAEVIKKIEKVRAAIAMPEASDWKEEMFGM